jgi:hypothetical protein
MGTQYAVAWQADDGVRFVGRLLISPSKVRLDGTSVSPDREHRQLQIDRGSIRRASVERHGELAAVHIETTKSSHAVEVLTGGRGIARAVVDELGGRPNIENA